MTEIITCGDAKSQGLKRYFTGKPCKRGHLSDRTVKTGNCIRCHYELRDRNIAHRAQRKWYINNSDKVRQYQRKWVSENRLAARSWYTNWRVNNPDKDAAKTAKRHATKLHATPQWLTPDDLFMIEFQYLKAETLTLMTGVKHHVDHIVPLQGKNVCGLHVPQNLQVLTANENISKSNKWAL
jgi:hypothetical protein